MAVKILIKRKIKDGDMQAAARLMINTRAGAMKQAGYISSESMRSLDDPSQITIVSMWQSIEAWDAWKNSNARKKIVTEFKEYLIGETEYEHYSLGLPME